MDSFSSPSSGSSSQFSPNEFRDQLKTQLAQAYAEEFLESMPPRTRGGEIWGRPPPRGRRSVRRGRGSKRDNSVNQPDVTVPLLPPAIPLAAPNPTAALIEALQAVVQIMMTTQRANASSSTRQAKCLRDFKRVDPQTFNGSSDDPTETQLWLRSIETMFELINCPDDQKVRCATFMLRDDAELWWQSTSEIISPEGCVISWAEFKDAFMEEYYSEDIQLRMQQKFTQLCQRGRSVTTYAREFIRMKHFAPELVNTDYRTTWWFVRGLDKRIRHIVEAISPATYAVALRAAKAMEGVEESPEPPPPIVKRKRRHDQVD
ncbi:uncharacterized protein LOC111435758 isoform X4 [Cucurbita moschata]|nr:uncharacterized protein LOC111435758 isoform X4 [Cucurbita moschata]